MKKETSRRNFLKTSAGAALLTAAPNMARGQEDKATSEALSWSNWSGSVTCSPKALLRPKTEDEIVKMLASGPEKIGLVGSGHSFTPVCATDGWLVSLAELRGVESTDLDSRTAKVWGGTKLQELHVPLREAGLAMENISDIDRQAITGAMGTSTHGTGRGIRSISNQIISMRIATAEGKIIECTESSDPELFKAAQVSLGTLGIVTQVTMQLMPTYRLHEKVWQASFDECFENLHDLTHDNRHFEFFYGSRQDACMMKTLNITEDMPNELKDVQGERIGHSDQIFPSVRSQRFKEMEFSIPEKNGPACFQALRRLMLDKHPDVLMPLEYRTVGKDDTLLGMAQGRDTVTISAHMRVNKPHEAFFGDVESIFRAHNGRPHWGKFHTHKAEDLKGLYPNWDRFQTVRKRIDPDGRFTNDHARELLT